MSLQSKAVAGDDSARNNVVRLDNERSENGRDREGRDEICIDILGMILRNGGRGIERRSAVGKARARDDAARSTSNENDERN